MPQPGPFRCAPAAATTVYAALPLQTRDSWVCKVEETGWKGAEDMAGAGCKRRRMWQGSWQACLRGVPARAMLRRQRDRVRVEGCWQPGHSAVQACTPAAIACAPRTALCALSSCSGMASCTLRMHSKATSFARRRGVGEGKRQGGEGREELNVGKD